jgi:glycosyltransferase involved in cell wall biosynthesis
MIEKSPRITIVIRARNEEFWLGKTLELVNLQTYEDFEVVLVDSGSTDNTVSIFRHHRPEDPLVELQNFKPGDAINRGIEAGSGELAVILSAHCIPVDENWLSSFMGAMEDKAIGAAYGRQLPLPSSHPLDKRDLLNIFGIEARVQKKDTFFHNANSIIRREIWAKLPFDSETPHIEDRLWAQKVISLGFYIAYEPKAAVYHHHGINHHSDSMRAEAISDILIRSTMANGNEYPEFLKPEHEPLLFCLLGHDQKEHRRYLPIIEGLAEEFKGGKIMINTRVPDMIKDQRARTLPRLESEDHFTFVDILAKMLGQAESDGFFPNCVLYLNPKLDGTSVDMVRDLLRLFYKGMYDSVFFAREEYNNLWFKDGKSYKQLMADYSPRAEKTPFFVAQYGYGIATKPEFIRTRELVGAKVGIIRIKEEK